MHALILAAKAAPVIDPSKSVAVNTAFLVVMIVVSVVGMVYIAIRCGKSQNKSARVDGK